MAPARWCLAGSGACTSSPTVRPSAPFLSSMTGWQSCPRPTYISASRAGIPTPQASLNPATSLSPPPSWHARPFRSLHNSSRDHTHRGLLRPVRSLTDVEEDSPGAAALPPKLPRRPAPGNPAASTSPQHTPSPGLHGYSSKAVAFISGARHMSTGREGQGTGSGVGGGSRSGDSGDSGSESGPEAAEEWAVAAGAKSRRSATKVVLDHVGRQKGLPAHRLDPVGARDDRQRPPEGPGPAGHLPPVDELRPSPRASPGPQDGNGDLSDSGTDLSDGAAAGSVPAWHGPVAAAMPSSTAGYGTRAEVVARLPASIMLLRHAECLTLDELQAHERVPNHDIPLSELGVEQARQLGQRLRPALSASGMCLYMYTSPFLRCAETARILQEELEEGGLVSGVREAVQLREQDWGNFQDPRVQAQCKEERLRYGRFYYRFPSGESVADVYDRLTIFQDHLVRDMCAGRFSENTSLAIVSHGLTLRVFAMRWLHWTVRQFLQVYNIPNAEPVVMHKEVDPHYLAGDNAHLPFMPHHTKCLYRLTPRALELLKGADPFMASSSSCFQGPRLASRAQARPDEEETRRQWADVDGMV